LQNCMSSSKRNKTSLNKFQDKILKIRNCKNQCLQILISKLRLKKLKNHQKINLIKNLMKIKKLK
jgi:hypothetical protein